MIYKLTILLVLSKSEFIIKWPIVMYKGFLKALWNCGKPLSPPVEKALKNKKQFFNTFPTGSETMSGFPQFHRFNNNFFVFFKEKNINICLKIGHIYRSLVDNATNILSPYRAFMDFFLILKSSERLRFFLIHFFLFRSSNAQYLRL